MREKDILLDYIIFGDKKNIDNTFIKLNILKNRENQRLREELERYRTRLKMTLKELKKFYKEGVFGKKRAEQLEQIITSIEIVLIDLEERKRERDRDESY